MLRGVKLYDPVDLARWRQGKAAPILRVARSLKAMDGTTVRSIISNVNSQDVERSSGPKSRHTPLPLLFLDLNLMSMCLLGFDSFWKLHSYPPYLAVFSFLFQPVWPCRPVKALWISRWRLPSIVPCDILDIAIPPKLIVVFCASHPVPASSPTPVRISGVVHESWES